MSDMEIELTCSICKQKSTVYKLGGGDPVFIMAQQAKEIERLRAEAKNAEAILDSYAKENQALTDHTPTPWSADLGAVLDSTGQILTNDDGEFTKFADAAFIVQAVNAHDDLVKLLGEVLEFFSAPMVVSPRDLRIAIEAALAKAGAA